MNRLPLKNFNINLTLLGGQAFNWKKIDENYYGIFQDCVIKFQYDGENLLWQTFPEENDFAKVEKLLRLDLDYNSILSEISKDEVIKKSVEKHSGLRILKQDFAQTFISFIVSQNSNIPKIKLSLDLLSQKFDRKLKVDNIVFNLFPTLEEIATLSIEELESTKIGYRAKFIKSCVQELLEKTLDKRMESLNLEEARFELIKLHGIGDKVADCILVFGLGFNEITPLDLWAKRALINLYYLDPKQNYESMQKWLYSKFGGNTAFAGQYLFEYVRNS